MTQDRSPSLSIEWGRTTTCARVPTSGRDRDGTEIERQSRDCITSTNNASETEKDRLYFVSLFPTIPHQSFCMSTRSAHAVIAIGVSIRNLRWYL